jgi:hypothetical protein
LKNNVVSMTWEFGYLMPQAAFGEPVEEKRLAFMC